MVVSSAEQRPGYRHDKQGRPVLAGLTWEETGEFELLDQRPPFGGDHVWPREGFPPCASEQRWLALWTKHRGEVEAMIAATQNASA